MRILKWYIGGGASYYTFASYYTPVIQARMEFFPQKRIGISLSANYDLLNKADRGWVYAASWDFFRPKYAVLDKLSIEPSISLYF